MTKQETIERWAKYIIPAVFKAEDALQKAQPEWRARLATLNDDTPHEVGEQLAKEYCTSGRAASHLGQIFASLP